MYNFKNEKWLMEMAKIGSYNDFDVIVRTNDPGNIPHFHIIDSNTQGERFHTCVMLKKAHYFSHTGKEDRLNSKQREELIKFLQQVDKNSRHKDTYWETLIDEWNRNNSKIKVSTTQEMPDYTKL